jgi:protocatechuate 3,4-dioxygenase beta subunit
MKTRPTTEDDITAEVVRRFEGAPDPRLRQIMQSLVRHLHAFVKEVRLTESEWMRGIEFLTATGQICDEKRQEFILLSDTLGVSMVVDRINHAKPDGATESTVIGPFYRPHSPELPAGGNIGPRDMGTPAFVSGRVCDLESRPIAGARLEVWQAASNGMYDTQDPSIEHMHMRGTFHSDKEGRFLVRTCRPRQYTIPQDGPVGEMLRATNRHAWRPAHIHFIVSADGYEPVTTHIFDSIDKYLNSDTVFAVKESLICNFLEHNTRDADAERFGADPPFCTVNFDFVLKPLQPSRDSQRRE